MSFDAFIWFENDDGSAPSRWKAETTDATYTANKAFEIFSFSWGASNPTTIGSGGGGSGGGKVSVSSFNVMKKSENSSPNFFAACCNGGSTTATAHVVLRKAAGTAGKTGTKFFQYDFKDVMVEAIQWSGSSGGDDTPTESVSFAFGACPDHLHARRTRTGPRAPTIAKSWSLVNNDDNCRGLNGHRPEHAPAVAVRGRVSLVPLTPALCRFSAVSPKPRHE